MKTKIEILLDKKSEARISAGLWLTYFFISLGVFLYEISSEYSLFIFANCIFALCSAGIQINKMDIYNTLIGVENKEK